MIIVQAKGKGVIFMVLFKNNANKEKTEQEEIETALANMNLSLNEAHARFNEVCDYDLIDACIFEIKSLESKYKFLLQQRKSMGRQKPEQ